MKHFFSGCFHLKYTFPPDTPSHSFPLVSVSTTLRTNLTGLKYPSTLGLCMGGGGYRMTRPNFQVEMCIGEKEERAFG